MGYALARELKRLVITLMALSEEYRKSLRRLWERSLFCDLVLRL